VQLFGSEPETLARSVDAVLPLEPDFIDLNMGCPVKKVVNRGAGSALMRTPEKAEAIVRGVKAALAGTGLPLDVKFRAGWDAASICAVDFGRRMEQAGADLLTLHPRTRAQMYDVRRTGRLIADLKRAVNVPVVGNGDVCVPQDAGR
jgi:tRNA-dihydrouridine synthase